MLVTVAEFLRRLQVQVRDANWKAAIAAACGTVGRQALQRLIDEAVERISRIMVQRSLLVAAYLTDKLDQADPALVEQPPGDELADSEDPDDGEDEPESDSDCGEDPDGGEPEQGHAEDLPDLFGKKSNFLRRCFTVGVAGCTSRHAGLEAKLAEWANAFPELQGPRYVGNAVSHAAKLYCTMEKTNCSTLKL